MLRFIVFRLVQGAGLMFVIAALVFLAVYLIGDPVELLINPEATQIDRQRAIERLGLDRPVWEQFLSYLGGLLQGDVGTSWVFNRPALTVMLERLPATLELAIGAVILSALIGIPLGLYAGYRPNSWPSRALMTGSIVGFSLPTFWVGIVFIVVFSVELGWFPVIGRGDTVEVLGVRWSLLTLDGLHHAALPILTLALSRISLVMRLVRSGTQEILGQDYVTLARAKGVPEARVLRKHVLPNLMIPLITVLGLDFAGLLAFAIVTETVFSWPGMGKLIIDSMFSLDRPMIVAYLICVAALFVLANLIVDLLYGVLDPRISLGDRAAR
ncbi:ABC transporter permease [Boseongicola sp. H5]|uniref:ABC transporter permease n=1 Tax=Boseongicola sp. H5 TaxID=2763261 RepID=UPI001D09F3D7|nr:ABC transporter permease [Boseongicola sp. H5]